MLPAIPRQIRVLAHAAATTARGAFNGVLACVENLRGAAKHSVRKVIDFAIPVRRRRGFSQRSPFSYGRRRRSSATRPPRKLLRNCAVPRTGGSRGARDINETRESFEAGGRTVTDEAAEIPARSDVHRQRGRGFESRRPRQIK